MAITVVGSFLLLFSDYESTWRGLSYRAEHEVPLATGVLAFFAVLGSAVAVLYAGCSNPRGGSRQWMILVLDMVGVLTLSIAVRYVLTADNILTDGGIAFGRVTGQIPRYQAAPILARAFACSDAPEFSDLISVLRAISALGPMLLLVFARSLGLGRYTSVFAGLLLASWPLHAALGSSDSLEAATLSIALLGLALIAGASRLSCPAFAITGLLVIAFAIWGRPESPIFWLPLLGIVVTRQPSSWLHPATVAAGSFALVGTAIHAIPAYGMSMPPFHLTWTIHGFPGWELAFEPAILPAWIWLPIPIGVVVMGSNALVVLLGILAGFLPSLFFFPWHPSETYTEVFKYSMAAMPFSALASASGIAALCERGFVSGLPHSKARTFGLAALFATPIMVTPLIEREYLQRRYGPTREIAAFSEALHFVPEHCVLIVPDDEGGTDDEPGSAETLEFFHHVRREVAARNERAGSLAEIVGMTEFLKVADELGTLPRFSDIGMGPSTDPTVDECWYFYRGTYCATGMFGRPIRACDRVTDLGGGSSVVWRHRFQFISYRLVTRPSHNVAPWYDADAELILVHLAPS